jgi:hypothetical protein
MTGILNVCSVPGKCRAPLRSRVNLGKDDTGSDYYPTTSIFVYAQPKGNQFSHMLSQKVTNFRGC